jgi:hypothetical protein
MGTAPQTASPPIFPLQTRLLGDDLAPPRHLYVTYIPATLAFVGVLSWVMGDEFGLVMASVVATGISFYALWDWLFHHALTRFSTLLAMSLLLGYGFGTLNTWISLPRSSLTLGDVTGSGEGVLARGLGAVLLSSACLFFLGEIFEKPLFGESFRFVIDDGMRTLVYIGAIAMLAGFATHSLGFLGVQAANGHVNIFGLFLSWLYTPLTAVTVAAFLTTRLGWDKLLTGLSAVIFLLMFSVSGRRVAIYTSIEILLVLGLVGFRWRNRGIRSILLILGLGAVVAVGALTFMLLRIAPVTHPTSHKVTLRDQFQAAGKVVQRGHAIALASAITQRNVQSRTLILPFLANILDASSRMTPALGRDAVGLSQVAIPSAIFPDKNLFFSEEGLVDQQFGFSYGDQANSILTAGATDFGFLGMILYPIAAIIIARIGYDLMARWFGTVPLMIITLSFILVFLQTEIGAGGYAIEVRNSLIFGVVLTLFSWLPRIRLRVQ